jgi:DnaJ-domain-containing protein 1
VDQIFERLERLVKAWVNSGSSPSPSRGRTSSPSSYGDPDLDAAMAELDDFLDTSKTETERREAEELRAQAQRERRAREEQSRRYGAQAGDGQTAVVIEQAYRYLGLKPYAPVSEAKAAYKKLLFAYHPDRNSSSPEALKKATETSTRINAAFQIIEAYEESKKGR